MYCFSNLLFGSPSVLDPTAQKEMTWSKTRTLQGPFGWSSTPNPPTSQMVVNGDYAVHGA
jgi:hypothetical protein